MTYLRRLSIVSIVTLAAVLLVAPGAAKGQGTLDQSQTQYNNAARVSGVSPPFGQIFTAGACCRLVRVDLVVGYDAGRPAGPLVVELQSTDAHGAPSGNVLAKSSIPADMVSSTPDWRVFLLDPVVTISPGTLYAITVTAPGVSEENPYDWAGSLFGGDPYPDGWALMFAGPDYGWGQIGGDFTFRTYVAGGTVGAPPDPADKIAELQALVDSLGLHSRLTKRLQRKLARALAALADEDTARACRLLRGFLMRIAAQRGKKLTVAQARQLSVGASDLRASLGWDKRGKRDRDDDQLLDSRSA